MKVFVAGATGVVGRPAVARLVADGHEVSCLSRREGNAALLEGLGAVPLEGSLFDADGLRHLVAGHDVVVNLATHIPPLSKALLMRAWKENDRIRTEGARNLVDAALAAGAGRYVQESISFNYTDAAADWIDEDRAVEPTPVTASALAAEGEAARFTAAGGTGVALRLGIFYGPDSGHSHAAVRLARRRIAMALGSAGAFMSSIATDDAGSAVAAALAAPPGIWNVGDDDPVTRREYADVVADAVGVRRLRMVPVAVAKLGGAKFEALLRSQRVANRRFREATGWAPAYPSVREGWPATVAAMQDGEAARA